MKRIIAILLTALFFITPVLAGWEPEANLGKVAFEFKGYAEKPVIDGKLDEYGYTKLEVAPGDISYAFNDSTADGEARARGLSFDVYASYDADYVYLFVSMDTKNYYNDLDPGDGNIWGQSAIQVNLAKPGDEGGDRLEYGLGRNSITGAMQSFVWAQHPGAGKEIDLKEGTDFVVVLDGNRIVYECRTPVETFMPKGTKLKQGDKITFCLVMAQCDKENGEGGTGGYIHTQIASGCTGSGKLAENFATITLGAPREGAPPPPPEPVVVEAPAAEVVAAPAPAPVAAAAPVVTSVPATGNATMIMMFVLIALAGIGARVVVTQRRK